MQRLSIRGAVVVPTRTIARVKSPQIHQISKRMMGIQTNLENKNVCMLVFKHNVAVNSEHNWVDGAYTRSQSTHDSHVYRAEETLCNYITGNSMLPV